MRSTRTTITVALAVLHWPDERIWGYPLHKRTGLKSGVIYPILHRFLDAGYLDDGWETSDDAVGRPARRYYTLTDAGRRALGAHVAAASESPKLGDLVASWEVRSWNF